MPAVALLGARQVGKTTLARLLVDDLTAEGVRAGADYLDLESPVDRAKLEDPTGYLQGRNGRLVVLDEVQRLPGLFETLRGIIDQQRAHKGHSGCPTIAVWQIGRRPGIQQPFGQLLT